MPNLGPTELLIILVGLLLVAGIIGGVVYVAVKLATRSRSQK